jgi:hypothetical protein
LQKYDLDKPVIITLDSLGAPRSNTCSALRQYIVQEAFDKLGLEISGLDIKGMTAKDIPEQKNFADCGLFLCLYLEWFMAEPYGFVRNILQRDKISTRWPNQIQSEDLRSRMRDFIMELHRQQEGEDSKLKIPELGKILIDMREPSPEVEIVHESPVPNPTTSQEILAQKERVSNYLDQRSHQRDEEGFQEEFADVILSPAQQSRLASEAVATIDAPDAPIVIEDDLSPVKRRAAPLSPSHWRHNIPGQLAEEMRQARGSPVRDREASNRVRTAESHAPRRDHAVDLKDELETTGRDTFVQDLLHPQMSCLSHGRKMKANGEIPETPSQEAEDWADETCDQRDMRETAPVETSPCQRAGTRSSSRIVNDRAGQDEILVE